MTTLPSELQARLVFRSHEADGCLSRVWYSRCDLYRYGLSRSWQPDAPTVLFLMLNPSTADEFRNDPTVARCETRARNMGFGGMMVANIFAFRATQPAELKKADDPIGPDNAAVLSCWTQAADMTIAAWGAHGDHNGQGREVAQTLPEQTYHLGVTKHGHPRHPLYVSFAKAPERWSLQDRYPSSI